MKNRSLHPALRRAIVEWLFENENVFCRCSACKDHFRQYIYDADGNFIIGGADVNEYITVLDTELFR